MTGVLGVLALILTCSVKSKLLAERYAGSPFWHYDSDARYNSTSPSLASFHCPGATEGAASLQVIWQLVRQFGTDSSHQIGDVAHYILNHRKFLVPHGNKVEPVRVQDLRQTNRSVTAVARLASPQLLRTMCLDLGNRKDVLRPILIARHPRGHGAGLMHDDATIPLPRECPWLKSVALGLEQSSSQMSARQEWHTSSILDNKGTVASSLGRAHNVVGGSSLHQLEVNMQTVSMAHLPRATGAPQSVATGLRSRAYEAPQQVNDILEILKASKSVFAFRKAGRKESSPTGAFAWEWLPIGAATRYLAAAIGIQATTHLTAEEVTQRLAELCELQTALAGQPVRPSRMRTRNAEAALHASARRLDPAACVRIQVGLTPVSISGEQGTRPVGHAVRVLPAGSASKRWTAPAERENKNMNKNKKGHLQVGAMANDEHNPVWWSVARPMQHAARAVASVCLGRVVHLDDVVLGKRPATQAHYADGRASDSSTGIPALRVVQPTAAAKEQILGDGIGKEALSREQGIGQRQVQSGIPHGHRRALFSSPFSAIHQCNAAPLGRCNNGIDRHVSGSGTAATRVGPYPPLPIRYGFKPELQVHVPASLTMDEITEQERCAQSAQILWDGPDLDTIRLLRAGLTSSGQRGIQTEQADAKLPTQLERAARSLGSKGWTGLSPHCQTYLGQWRGPEWLDGTTGMNTHLSQLQTGAVLDPRQMVDACLEDGEAAFDRLKTSMGSSHLEVLDVTPLSMARSLCFWMDSCTPGKDPGCLRGFHPRPMPFLSQQVMQQDLWVVQIAMQGKKGGFFIEAGAVDGRMLSTTWALERGFGWRGLLVEARGEELEAMRVRRPRSTCVYAALGARDGGFLEMSASGDDPTGMMAVTSQVDTSGLDQSGWQDRGRAPIRRLSSILDEMGAPSRIDFLTLDIEGGELEVLESFPFDRYSFGAMAIETNNEEPRRSQIRGVLASHGYVYAGGMGMDDAYLHPEVAADVLGSLEDQARARRGRGRRVAFGGRDIGT